MFQTNKKEIKSVLSVFIHENGWAVVNTTQTGTLRKSSVQICHLAPTRRAASSYVVIGAETACLCFLFTVARITSARY